MSIGDINSKERGSGARYNTGKPRLDLIPLWIPAAVQAHMRQTEGATPFESWQENARQALAHLGNYQMRGDWIYDDGSSSTVGYLYEAVTLMWSDWSACADVFTYGLQKYAEWNWLKGMPWSAVIASCARHLLAMMREGDSIDVGPNGVGLGEGQGSGLPHRGHVLCNLVMLITYTSRFPEGDDRPPKFEAPKVLQVRPLAPEGQKVELVGDADLLRLFEPKFGDGGIPIHYSPPVSFKDHPGDFL